MRSWIHFDWTRWTGALRPSLRLKLLLPVIGGAVLLIAIIGFIFISTYNDFVRRNRVEAGQRVDAVHNSFLDKLQQANNIAQLIAKIPDLGDAIDARDQGVIAQIVEPFTRFTDLNFLTVYNRDLEVFARGDAPGRFGFADELRPWLVALVGQPSDQIHAAAVPYEGRLMLLAAEPIRTVNERFGGVAVAGFVIDDRFLAGIKQRTGADIIIAYDRRPIVATVDSQRLHAKGMSIRPVEFDASTEGAGRLALSVALDEAPQRAAFSRRLATVIAILAMTSIVVVGSALALTLRLVGPIKALRAGAARIGSGDLASRISIRTGDELEVLADQFNQMAGRLQASYADLEKKVELRTRELALSVEELRALGEVSQAVNSTLELETVLNTIVAKATQLSGTEAGAIYVHDDAKREFHLRATYGMDQALIASLTQRRISLDNPNFAQALAETEPVQIADLKEQPTSAVNDIILRAGFRALLVAPLVRGEDVVGMLVVRRRTPGAFAQNTVDLIKTFAAQSAVAIENARLFQNVETSLEDLRTAQDRLVQTQKLASLGQLTTGIAHEIKNPLNFVNNFSGVSVELIDELQETLGRVTADKKTRDEIAELAGTLRGNLDKIVQHGKRADSIVKNMLLHSREGSGERRPIDINAVVEEAVNLAYHGARAEKQDFNITLERSLDPTAGQLDCFPQEITRVLLNLISNGFYATTQRKAQADNGRYEPTLTATT